MQSKVTEPQRKVYTVLREDRKALTILPQDAPLVVLQSGAGRPPFFVVDSFHRFIDLVELIGTDQPVLCLVPQYEAHIVKPGEYDIHHEAAEHVKTILERQPQGPYRVGGFSASGIVAYEITQQLKALGHQVALLVMFETPNPHFMREYSPFLNRLASHRADWSRMRWGEVPAWAAGKLWRKIWLHHARSEANQKALAATPLVFARIGAAQRYRPALYSGRILLVKRYRGLEGQYFDPEYGWGEVVQGRIEICLTSAAEHLEILESATDRELVANTLRSCMDAVEASSLHQQITARQ
jgi:thioesterase domain-containing protein